jgi:hypothetical protein
MASMRNQLLVVTVLLLASGLPLKAQTVMTHISMSPSSVASPSYRRTFSSSVILFNQLPDKPTPRPSVRIDYLPSPLAATYKPEPSLESLLQMEEFRTSLVTESSFEMAHVWRGLQLDFVESTVHSRGLQLGSPMLGIGFRDLNTSANDQASVANSVEGDAISLTYTFGHNDGSRRQAKVLRCVSWVVGKDRSCPL